MLPLRRRRSNISIGGSWMEWVEDRVVLAVVWLQEWLTSVSRSRQPAIGLVEYALMAVVVVAVAAVGLTQLGTDLSSVFSDLGAKLKLPSF
jgi:Flp pilus assembly pilin Flp